MEDYYRQNYKDYHEKTFCVDPTSFLTPLCKKLKPGATILDVGCGSGRDLIWLKKRGFHVMGIERSEGLAELAIQNTGIKIIVADFEIYDFSQLSVDAILLVGALIHLNPSKLPNVIHSIIKALKQNGYILITLKKGMGTSHDSHGREFYLWQHDELCIVFSDMGLNVTEFFQQSSNLDTDEIWLGFVLEKAKR